MTSYASLSIASCVPLVPMYIYRHVSAYAAYYDVSTGGIRYYNVLVTCYHKNVPLRLFSIVFLLKRTKTFFYIKYNSFSNKFILCFSLGVRSRQKLQLNEAPNFFFPGVAGDWIRSCERKFFRLKMFNFILFWCGNLIFCFGNWFLRFGTRKKPITWFRNTEYSRWYTKCLFIP